MERLSFFLSPDTCCSMLLWKKNQNKIVSLNLSFQELYNSLLIIHIPFRFWEKTKMRHIIITIIVIYDTCLGVMYSILPLILLECI